MTRDERILKYVARQGAAPKTATSGTIGIEIAPFFNPLLPKAAGHPVLVLDVLDRDGLRRQAMEVRKVSAAVADGIEEVDMVGSACEIAALAGAKGIAGQVGYIVSSHNFEHLPNPVKFLEGAAAVLAPGGVLSMAVPDYRACFDHFRFPTRLSDWLEAYFEDRAKPSPAQLFEGAASRAGYVRPGRADVLTSCDLSREDWRHFVPDETIDAAFSAWRRDLAATDLPYVNTHCSALFGETAELMVRDLIHLGLVELEVLEVSGTHTAEFYIHLRKPEAGARPATDAAAYYRCRAELMRQISGRIGAAGYPSGPVTAVRRWLRTARHRLKGRAK